MNRKCNKGKKSDYTIYSNNSLKNTKEGLHEEVI